MPNKPTVAQADGTYTSAQQDWMRKQAIYQWLDNYRASQVGQKATGELMDAPGPADIFAPAVGHAVVNAAKIAGSMGRSALQKAVGRVVTNTVIPVGYDVADKLLFAKQFSTADKIKAIVNDEALWSPESVLKNWDTSAAGWRPEMEGAQLRDTPYREMFGLKPRYEVSQYAKNPDGSIRFTDPERLSDIASSVDEAGAVGTHPYDNVMGHFDYVHEPRRFDGVWDYGGTYRDTWDFGLNPGEKVTDNFPQNLLRYAVDKITDPVTIKGRVPNMKRSANPFYDGIPDYNLPF